MKKLLALLLAGVIVLAFAGCSKKDDSTDVSADTDVSQEVIVPFEDGIGNDEDGGTSDKNSSQGTDGSGGSASQSSASGADSGGSNAGKNSGNSGNGGSSDTDGGDTTTTLGSFETPIIPLD